MSIASLYKRSKSSSAGRRSKRISGDEKQGLKSEILVHVKKNAASKASDIARALKKPSRQVGAMLREMMGDGVLSKAGERAQTTYTAA